MTDATATPHTLGRHANGRFGPGNPGRRPGSRNRASHRAVLAILDDFEMHQEQVLGRLREFFTPHYIDIVSRLLPRQIEVAAPDLDSYSEAEIAHVVRQARSALDRIEEGRGSLIELESALVVETTPDADADGRGHRINGDLR
jgi:hypothetical protein